MASRTTLLNALEGDRFALDKITADGLCFKQVRQQLLDALNEDLDVCFGKTRFLAIHKIIAQVVSQRKINTAQTLTERLDR